MNKSMCYCCRLLTGLTLILSVCLLAPLSAAGQSVQKKVKEGNRLYSEEQYDQALNRYQDALLSRPNDRRIRYNVGNSLYRNKKFDEALKEYRQVVGTEEIPLEAETCFNMGNTFFRMGKLQESISAYQQALKLNPDDLDSKYNLEYVRRRLMEEEKKQPQQGGEEQDPGSSQEQPQPEPRDESGEEEKSDREQQSSAGEQPDSQPKDTEPSGEFQKLSREEAERILNAMKDDEKDIQKKRKMKISGKPRIKKDW